MEENATGKDEKDAPVKRTVSFEISSIALTGLLLLALLYTAYFAREVLLPATLALLFTFLLRPVIRAMKKIRIPEIAGSGIVVLAMIGAVGYGAEQLTGPAIEWMDRAPDTMHKIQQKVKGLVLPVRKVTRTAEELQKITGNETKEKQRVEVKSQPSLSDTLFSGMKEFFAKGAVMVFLLFFFLASGDLFVKKIAEAFPKSGDKAEVAATVSDIESSMSRYLLTVTAINIAEGVIVSIVMYAIGMPSPVLWGVMAAFLIYIPYLGPLVGVVIVGFVALLTFQNTGRALLAPGLYFIIDALQGQIITPLILGQRFELNPAIIFLWLIFWGWIWGIPGALMAVPLLTLFKILCDHIGPLGPIGKFLEK